MTAEMALAVADFRERRRRPGFWIVLIGALVFGYFAAPPAHAAYALLQVGDYRGTYNSQYVGTVLALTSGVWLAFAGFFVVKETVSRDESTGVGQILAATPLSSRAYLFGKFLSNFLVLAAMTGAVALMAVIMLLIRGESADFNLVELWLPFVLFTIPVMAAVAGLALLFETARGLRGTLGNIVWAAGYFVVYVVSQVLYHLIPGTHVDPFGMAAASRSMRADVLAAHPGAGDPAILVAVITGRTAPGRFLWTSGLQIDATMLLERFALILFGVAVALLGALWFGRFDPTPRAGSEPPGAETNPATDPDSDAVPDPTMAPGLLAGPSARSVRTLTPAKRGRPFGRLVASELRILLSRVPLWWFLGAAALAVAGAIVPVSVATNPLLPVAWLWPLLIWSRVGTQEYVHNVHPLIAAAPAGRRRLLAEWLAALLLTAIAGVGPLVRLIMAGDSAGTVAWLCGALFISTMALALGTFSRSPRVFQGVYLMLWLLVISGERTFDFMGAVRSDGHPVGPAPVAVLAVTAVLAVATAVAAQARQARR